MNGFSTKISGQIQKLLDIINATIVIKLGCQRIREKDINKHAKTAIDILTLHFCGKTIPHIMKNKRERKLLTTITNLIEVTYAKRVKKESVIKESLIKVSLIKEKGFFDISSHNHFILLAYLHHYFMNIFY